jgi:hypothetical protein
MTLAYIAARTRRRAPATAGEKEVFDVYSAVAVGPVLSREGAPDGARQAGPNAAPPPAARPEDDRPPADPES